MDAGVTTKAGGGVRLGVDCGSVTAAAVLAWPDGRWQALTFDGAVFLPAAAWVGGDGTVVTGAAAWRQALDQPAGFVAAPVRQLADGPASDGAGAVAAVDLVAAVLRRVGEEAARIAGGPVGEVRLVVPAGWGPRRRTVMRQAAHRAGLDQPTLVEAPVAAATHLVGEGVPVLVGSFVAVCDFGGGFEATVLRRTPVGFEVLSTIDCPQAGGRHLDQVMADQLAALADGHATGQASPPAGGPERLALLAAAHTARQDLAVHPAVTVALPGGRPPVVLTSGHLDTVIRAALSHAADTLRAAVDAADLRPDQLTAVLCVGGGVTTTAAQAIGEQIGHTPTVAARPQLAAAVGAANATGPAAADQPPPVEPAPPPVRRAVGVLLSGLASVALATHFITTAEVSRTRPRGFYDPHGYLLANWGELAVAGVLALVACAAVASLIASILPALDPVGRVAALSGAGQIGPGLLSAAAGGLAIAGLYAVGASVYFDLPSGPFLRWALLPVLPAAAVVAAAGVLAGRRGRTPAQGWHGWLNFPAGSVVCAAAGMLLVQGSMTARVFPAEALLNDLVGRGGAFLLGVGAAWALVAAPVYRIVAAAPLGVFTAAVFAWSTTGILGVLYAAAVAGWWLHHLWLLARPARKPAPQP